MKILSKKRLRKKAGFFGKYTVIEDYELVLFYLTKFCGNTYFESHSLPFAQHKQIY